MGEPYEQGLASRLGPELCVPTREGWSEALAGVWAGPVSSRENTKSGVPRQSREAEGNTRGRDMRATSGPRAVTDPVHVQNSIVRELRDPVGTRGPKGPGKGGRRR